MLGITNEAKDMTVCVSYLPGRKKPCLSVIRGNVETKYASFDNEESAYEFIEELMEILNLQKEDVREYDL